MTQKRRPGRYPFRIGRNKSRQSAITTTSNVGGENFGDGDDEIVNIVEVKEQAQSFIENNQKWLLGGLLGLVLLVGGYLVWKYLIIAPKEKAAIEAMRIAQDHFAKDSFNLALENPNTEVEGFLSIIDNYSGTASANTAKYYAGISYLNLGKYESAIEFLEDYSAKDNITPAMKYGALGDAYSELKDMDKALSLYEKAVSESGENDFTGPYFLRKVALLHYADGKTDQSLAAWKSLMDKFPESAESKEAEKFIARLEK